MNKTKNEMLNKLEILLDNSAEYNARLEAYEFLLEECDDIVDDMVAKMYSAEGEAADMLMEVLARYKGNKAIYLGLVGGLYKGDDVALYARLLGSYGDEAAINVLKAYADEYELDYNEFMEVRNAVEELGGDFEKSEKDFAEDPFYRYLKGMDEPEEDSRRSPFEDLFKNDKKDEDCGDDECAEDCDDGCSGHGDCGCGGHHEHQNADGE